jgi:transposase
LHTLEWISAAPKNKTALFGKAWLPAVSNEPDLLIVLEHLLSKRVLERRRAMVILASRRGVRPSMICRLLRLSPSTCRRCIRVYTEGGAEALFAHRQNPHRKFDNDAVRNTLFSILHQPPSNFDINRTAWRMADLARIMKEKGQSASEDVIRKIIKVAGFRWRKARIVLTSNDPEFTAKVEHIRSILSTLKADEGFFSIDEYGPFAVKAQAGKALVGPGERRLVQQWQQSRGCIIVTAAIELSSNQVTHFSSTKKNTAEMIRMMGILVQQYRDRSKIYLSWDSASWHISKQLFKHIHEHNNSIGKAGPLVETSAGTRPVP